MLERLAGPRLLEPAQADDLARARGADVVVLGAEHAEDAADPHAAKRHDVLDLAGPDPDQGQLARMRQMIGLEHLDQGRATRIHADPRRGHARIRGFLEQRLEQPADPHVAFGDPHEHRHDLIGAERLLQMTQDVVGRRLLLLEQHLHQVVVEVGERLEHLGARRLLALAIFLGQVDPVRRRAVVVAVGLLGHQVDVADQLVAAPDRILVRDHRPVGQIAQALQEIAIANLRAVHLVDEHEMRDLVLSRGT